MKKSSLRKIIKEEIKKLIEVKKRINNLRDEDIETSVIKKEVVDFLKKNNIRGDVDIDEGTIYAKFNGIPITIYFGGENMYFEFPKLFSKGGEIKILETLIDFMKEISNYSGGVSKE